MGRIPCSPAGVADIVSPQEGFETELGILKIAEGIFARPSETANRFIYDREDIDGGRAPERASLANGTASRRSVLTGSPAFWGISDGATTQQSSSLFVRER
jgi:hypothetical protein